MTRTILTRELDNRVEDLILTLEKIIRHLEVLEEANKGNEAVLDEIASIHEDASALIASFLSGEADSLIRGITNFLEASTPEEAA